MEKLDRLGVFIEVQHMQLEWVLSALRIFGKQDRQAATASIQKNGIAKFIHSLSEDKIDNLRSALLDETPASIDIPGGYPGNSNRAKIIVKLFDRHEEACDREATILDLSSVNDLRLLFDKLTKMQSPVFLRSIESVHHGSVGGRDKYEEIFDGDIIQAQDYGGKLSTFLAYSSDRSSPAYVQLYWCDETGFLTGSKKLNAGNDPKNHYCFTMTDKWSVIGNYYIDRSVLFPPARKESDHA